MWLMTIIEKTKKKRKINVSKLLQPSVYKIMILNFIVQWSVEAPDEKLSYLREFVVEFRQRDPMKDNSTSLWTQSDRIPPHVKAVTLRRLN